MHTFIEYVYKTMGQVKIICNFFEMYITNKDEILWTFVEDDKKGQQPSSMFTLAEHRRQQGPPESEMEDPFESIEDPF